MDITKVLPHSVEAEQTLIAGLLDETGRIKDVSVALSDLYRPEHRVIYGAIKDLGDRASILTVTDYLIRSKRLDAAGGASYISSLVDVLPTGTMFEGAVSLIRDKADNRQLIDAVRKTEHQALNGGNATELVARLKQKIELIETRFASLSAIPTAATILDKLKQNIERNKQAGLGIDCGLRFLRKAIIAMIRSHLWVIGGYTSTGKTALLNELIARILQLISWARIAVFSTEMSAENYILRLAAHYTGIPSLTILKGEHIPEVQEQINEAFEVIAKKNLVIFDDLYEWPAMAETARMLKRQWGLDVLFIDFVQNILGDGSIYERMSRLAPQIQALAKELYCNIVVASQVSNESMRDTSPIIGYKGGGELPAAADLGLWLEREKGADGYVVNSDTLNVII